MTAVPTPRHQVASATAHLRGIADTMVDASVWSMTATEAGQTLVELTRLEAQVVELKSRVAAHADDLNVGEEVGATSTANWLAAQTRQTRPAAFRAVKFGHQLGAHPLTRDALAAGDLRVEQADVIIRALDALPDDVDSDLVEKAEAHLVAQAAHHDAKALSVLGRRLFEVIAPDEADRREAEALEREEREAAQACRLSMSDDGHGKVHGRFTLSAVNGARLKKMLLALCAPKHLTATEQQAVVNKPGPHKLGHAFSELIERISARDLPKVGGTDATVVVIIELDVLLGRLEKAGVLDTGERISPSEARRLACAARIIPVVLGGKSEVLDVARAGRYYSNPQRTAMTVRDRGCTTEGCDMPPWLCHAHHNKRWADGGLTDLADGRLLCPRHHARAHDPTYEMKDLPGGKVAFHRRT